MRNLLEKKSSKKVQKIGSPECQGCPIDSFAAID
jgi:hypothetical protein